MSEWQIGDVIRMLRERQGVTQEVLAEGICAPSTLSRIENNSQRPQVRTEKLLLERLNVFEPLAPSYTDADAFEAERLKTEILSDITQLRFGRLDEKLYHLKELLPEDPLSAQQLRCLMLLWEAYERELLRIRAFLSERGASEPEELSGSGDLPAPDRPWCLSLLSECRALLQKTCPWYAPELPGKDSEKTAPPARKPLTRIEAILVNMIGIASCGLGQYETALRHFLLLSEAAGWMRDSSPVSEAALRNAIIVSNLSACIAGMRRVREAKKRLEKIFAVTAWHGGGFFALRLLRNRSRLYHLLPDPEHFESDVLQIRRNYPYLPKELRQTLSCPEFMLATGFFYVL